MSARYPDFHVEMLEVYHNPENQQKFSDVSRQYNLGNVGIPLIVIGNRTLAGDIAIRDHLEESILAERARLASGNTTPSLPVPAPAIEGPPGTVALTIPVIVLSALIDSINPCAFAILIFLLISLVAAGNRLRILLVGGTYVAAMFLFHLFVGIGFFSVISLSGYSRAFSLIGAAIAIVLGLITILDVIRNNNAFLLSVPISKKGMIGRYLEKMSVPAAFILGILAGLFGFSCTGGIYISILGLMGRNYSLLAGVPYLVLYNVIFVLPLIIVVLLVAYGVSPGHAENWRLGSRRILRLIVGLAMIAIGLVIVSGWIG
jgi:cytochrome c biogenesis protein CcdA